MDVRQLAYGANRDERDGPPTFLSPTIRKLYFETCSNFRLAIHASKHCEDKMRYYNKAIVDAFAQLGHMGVDNEQCEVQEFL